MTSSRSFPMPDLTGFPAKLRRLQQDVIACELCPRLREHCRNVAEVKRRAYRDERYWGRPVPSFGDPKARLLIVGLAPGAHGANRTGRMFTGDSSGDLLYRTLYETGFASQPESTGLDDGLTLQDAYITAAVRCAPPQNRPSNKEIAYCASILEKELIHLHHVIVVVALGRLARDAYLDILIRSGKVESRAAYAFRHGAVYEVDGGPALVCSYHPSRQNTQTGRLSADMFRQVFALAHQRLNQREGPGRPNCN